MSNNSYVHGYSDREKRRLGEQADVLAGLLHHDTLYPPGERILEAGCGVGAQTTILADRNPLAEFVSLDISEASVTEARAGARARGLRRVTFAVGDILDLPFPDHSFDHVFICFVLEHLQKPLSALASLRRVLRDGGTLTAIEGDHGSAYFHPDSSAARRSIQCLIEVQARKGGDALIGRKLYPILVEAGFQAPGVSPRMVYADAGRPDLAEGFTVKTFTAMVEGVREQALDMGLVDEETWKAGIDALHRTAEGDGTFCYTFFKATAVK
ncbi:MAG: methyltransferase domain-containing protein [bacterium]|nr:MAG: methyltransferase domain-containing protein [bacterium]